MKMRLFPRWEMVASFFLDHLCRRQPAKTSPGRRLRKELLAEGTEDAMVADLSRQMVGNEKSYRPLGKRQEKSHER
jgi:hypothetical protein